MKSTNDKIKGQANSAAGKVKVAMGEITGSTKMKLKGEAQKFKGEAQKASGNFKESVNKGLKKLSQ